MSRATPPSCGVNAPIVVMDIISSTAIRMERDEIDYCVKLVIDEMARRALWRIMRQ